MHRRVAGHTAQRCAAEAQLVPIEKKQWIKEAMRKGHKGDVTRRAHRHHTSVHQEAERDSHSKNPHLRGQGQLALRFEKMRK